MKQCAICQRDFDTLDGLKRHVGRTHRMSVKDYTIQYELKGVIPVCECGCGQEVAWNKGRPRRFVHMHQHNVPEIVENMGRLGAEAARSDEVRAKVSATMTRKWAEDEEFSSNLLAKLPKAREKALIKRSMLQQDPAWRAARSQSKREFWASPRGDIVREYMRSKQFSRNVSQGSRRAFEADPSIGERRSAIWSKMQADGVVGPNMTNREWITDPYSGRMVHVHSTWERDFMLFRHGIGKPVVRDHNVRITYSFMGRKRIYTPDFTSLDGIVVYEVKGRMTEVDYVKHEAARQYCLEQGWTFVVINKANLFDESVP